MGADEPAASYESYTGELRSGLRPVGMHRLPEIRETTIESYGGKTVRALLAFPVNRDELRGAFAFALQKGFSVTFRGGGHAFDTQSLNDKLVISLEKLRRIDVDGNSATVTAEAGARWGDILAKCTAAGMVPHVMVTTHTATAGGTLSSNSLSRFSPTLGREGQHVLRFSLMTLDGVVHECSRDQNPDLFFSVIGGLGFVGAVLDVTHQLLPLRIAPRNIAVATTFTKVTGLESIAKELVSHIRKKAGGKPVALYREAAASARRDPAENVWAVSAVVYMQGQEVGLIAKSQYSDTPPRSLKRSVFHSPNSPGAWLLQVAALFPVLRDIGYRLVLLGYDQPKDYVDELQGYTFFEDGNRNLRMVGRAFGLPMGIHQHTFIVPFDPLTPPAPGGDDPSSGPLERFLGDARSTFAAEKVSPTLIDVLYLPDDGGDRFLLSSSFQMPGFAVTFTFEDPFSASFEDERRALGSLVSKCQELGGRVHLVKNVDATAKQVMAMYGQRVDEMALERTRRGATARVSNDFMKKVLPELEPPS
jgi:decaprenylphospho-beta-D-ribofuranose 2-oxidase